MPKRMLIDSSHPEETRVVVLDGQKVEEFDFEAATKRPLKGNIYLAKVTRVEPSLQAAFVEYGGNRQGFLAFSEIHPDYYQIPIADREALLAEQEAEAKRRATEEGEYVETSSAGSGGASDSESESEDDEQAEGEEEADAEFAAQESDSAGLVQNETQIEASAESTDGEPTAERPFEHHGAGHADEDDHSHDHDDHGQDDHGHDEHDHAAHDDLGVDVSGADEEPAAYDAHAEGELSGEPQGDETSAASENFEGTELVPSGAPGEGQQASAPLQQRRPAQRSPRRHRYKIQEVIKRRQILLIQVVKEERGNKGAALTTFLSLPGRYCVLMPNTPRGGGISRKITNVNDRKRLKSAAQSLELPEGMGLIIRTAGESRTKTEIKRDYEYLLRLWDTIRELTLKSNAPACVYEEGDLIKRAIRDLYNKDISEVVVEGDDGYRNAKDFMRMIMPSHAKNVKPYKDPLPLFQRNHIEAQLDAMFSPTVHLKSGGYLVINQTEALVSIDVNSGRATREHSIEETAYKTNLEAADEIARQLRLRDLAGLVVIDFIDMEDGRNDRAVEKRIYNAVKNDRARIQIGKISQFGLLEMSRQRLRAGVVAGSTIPCPHCGGQGIVRSVESTALRVLRGIEEEGQRQRAAILSVQVASDVAVYTLNQKRREIARLEAEYDITIMFEPKNEMIAGTFEIVRTGTRAPSEITRAAITVDAGFTAAQTAEEPEAEMIEEEIVEEEEEEDSAEERDERPQQQQSGDGQQQGEGGRRRRKRRRRGGRDREREPHEGGERPVAQSGEQTAAPREQTFAPAGENTNGEIPADGQPQNANGEGGMRKRRRRRRRGRGGRQEGEFAAQQTGQANGEGARAETGGYDDTGAAREPHAAVTAPNAPSGPVWSLTQDHAPRTETPPPQTASDDPAQPSRKGWWQRTFKS